MIIELENQTLREAVETIQQLNNQGYEAWLEGKGNGQAVIAFRS
ncbi:MAG: hypothetical protein ACOC5T_01660 [Elusimicrobiota bacterium]